MPIIPVQSTDGLLKRHVTATFNGSQPSHHAQARISENPSMCITTLTAKNLKDQIEFTMGGSELRIRWIRWTLDFSEVGATWEVKDMSKSTGRRSTHVFFAEERKTFQNANLATCLTFELLFRLVIPGEGLCLIIENVENEVDPMLDPVLDKQIIKKGSLVQRSWLRWGILKDQVQRLKGNWDLVILHSHKPSDSSQTGVEYDRIWVKCFERGWPSGCTHLNFPESQGKNKYINVSDQNMDYKVPKLGMRRYSWLKVWAVQKSSTNTFVWWEGKILWFSYLQNTKPRKSRLFWVFDNTLPTSHWSSFALFYCRIELDWGRFGMDFCKSFLFCHGFGHFQACRIISACTSPPDCRILTSVQSCQPKPRYFG